MGGEGTATMHKCPVPGSHITIAYPGTDLTTQRLVLIQGGFGWLCKIMKSSFHFIPSHLQQLVKWALLGFSGRVSCVSCSYVIFTCISLSIMITDFILSLIFRSHIWVRIGNFLKWGQLFSVLEFWACTTAHPATTYWFCWWLSNRWTSCTYTCYATYWAFLYRYQWSLRWFRAGSCLHWANGRCSTFQCKIFVTWSIRNAQSYTILAFTSHYWSWRWTFSGDRGCPCSWVGPLVINRFFR